MSEIVPFHTTNRQWDARFNVPTDDDLNDLLKAIQCEWDKGKFRYCLVSGTEIGDQPYHSDYGIRHVHCAFIYINNVTKASILKNLVVKQGNGYYLVPRNRDLPYSGWRAHHTKTATKTSDVLVLYEKGHLPEDETKGITKRSEEEKKRKLDDIIVEMKGLIESGNDQEAFTKFPKNYLTYGQKLKAMIHQKRDFFKTNGDMHIWLWGGPGSGKSAILQVVYPDYYNKNLDNRFFDRFDADHHTHVLLQDVDHDTIERLGVQFLKTICDEAGFPIDQKYLTPQIIRTTVLVSSNFVLDAVVPEDMKGRNETLAALRRRFWIINVRDILPILGVKLLPKYEISQLKKAGNLDPRKLFMSWDYTRDCPTGEPLKEAKEYQDLLKAAFYK